MEEYDGNQRSVKEEGEDETDEDDNVNIGV